ncbi:MAG: hypothetical protein ABIB97_04900 [Patescibacteria group bacterium]
MPQFELQFQFVAMMQPDQAEVVAARMEKVVPFPHNTQSLVTKEGSSCMIWLQVDGPFSDNAYATDWAKAARRDMLATVTEEETVVPHVIVVAQLKED